MQRRCARDDDEEADHPREHRPDDHVEVLVAKITRGEAFVDGVGLDEAQAPGRQGGADRCRRDEDGIASRGEPGDDQAGCGSAPVGVGQHRGGDVGQEHGADRHQHVLDPVEVRAHHERCDGHGGERHAHVTAHPEQLEPGGDPGVLGAGGADVGDEQKAGHERGAADSGALPDQSDEALAGCDAHAGGELVEHDEGDRRGREHPQEPVAVLGAEYRVGRDSGRVVVGQPGEQAGAEHGQHGEHAGAAAVLRTGDADVGHRGIRWGEMRRRHPSWRRVRRTGTESG